MQQKAQNKIPKKRGRPKESSLTARELARNRKRRQRARLANSNVSKIEIPLPKSLKAQLLSFSRGKSISEIGLDAFKLWLKAKAETRED